MPKDFTPDLATIQAQRSAVASRFRSPAWFFPVEAGCVLAAIASHDLDNEAAAGAVSVAALIGMGVAVWAAERTAPFKPHWRSAGRKAGLTTLVAFLAVMAAAAAAAFVSSRSEFPLTWTLAGLVSGAVVWGVGHWYDASVRSDLAR